MSKTATQPEAEYVIPTVDESIYDHPKYYDLVFNADVAAEAKFILACENEFVSGKRGWFFEPACGTGRLMYALARRGINVCGLDLNEKAVNYCNARLQRHGVGRTAVQADMCDFSLADFAGVLPKAQDHRSIWSCQCVVQHDQQFSTCRQRETSSRTSGVHG